MKKDIFGDDVGMTEKKEKVVGIPSIAKLLKSRIKEPRTKVYAVDVERADDQNIESTEAITKEREAFRSYLHSVRISGEAYQILEATLRAFLTFHPLSDIFYAEIPSKEIQPQVIPSGVINPIQRIASLKKYITEKMSDTYRDEYGFYPLYCEDLELWDRLIEQYEYLKKQIKKHKKTPETSKIDPYTPSAEVERLMASLKELDSDKRLRHGSDLDEMEEERAKNFENLLSTGRGLALENAKYPLKVLQEIVKEELQKILITQRVPKSINFKDGKILNHKLHPFFTTYTIAAKIIYGQFMTQLKRQAKFDEGKEDPHINVLIAKKLNFDFINFLPESFDSEDIKNKNKTKNKYDARFEELGATLGLYDLGFFSELAQMSLKQLNIPTKNRKV